jgi:hypothetical protein
VAFNNNVTANPMKDIKGAWRTNSLFYEYPIAGYAPLWTVMDTDRVDPDTGITYPSLKRIYLSYEHVPGNEYDFANEIIGSWEHWNRLCKTQKFSVMINSWREELEVKVRANAVKSIIRTSTEGSSAGATAAKWLAEKGYAPTRGRPTKAEKEGHLKQEDKIYSEIEDDLARVGLTVIK